MPARLMTPGPVEEAGQTVRATIDAMRATPGVLAILLFNLLFIGLVGWLSKQNNDHLHELLEITIKQCAPARGSVEYWLETKIDETTGQSQTRGRLRFDHEDIKPETITRVREITREAVDNALREQIEHLFQAWMKDDTGQPARASVGAHRAINAYRLSVEKIIENLK